MADLLDKYLKDQETDTRGEVGLALKKAVTRNPDTHAETQRLAESTGLPIDAVEQERETVESRSLMDKYLRQLDEAPITRNHMADPEFGSVAQDDLDNLTATEGLGKAFEMIGERTIEGTKALGRNAAATAQAIVDYSVAGERDKLKRLTPKERKKAEARLERALVGVEELGKGFSDIATSETLTAKDIDRPGGLAGFGLDVIEQIPQVVGMAGITAVAGPAAGGAFIGTQIMGSDYLTLREEGVDVETAVEASFTNAALQAPLELIGVSKALKFWKAGGAGASVFKAFIESAGTEFITEYLQSYPDEATKIWARAQAEGTDVQAQVGKFLDEVSTVAWQRGALYEGAVGSVLGGTMGGSGQVFTNRRKVVAAQDEADAIKQVVSFASESKLRERAPAKYRAWVANILAQGKVEDFHIEAERIKDVLEQAGMPAEKFAEMSEVFADQYEDALANGQDVIIPAADYLTNVVGSEISDALLPHLRGTAGGFSLAEATTMETKEEQDLADYQKAFEEQEGLAVDDSAKIIDHLLPQLTAMGLNTAGGNYDNALAVAEWFVTQGRRAKLDPVELYMSWNVTAKREGVEAAAKGIDLVDVEIDRARLLNKGEAAKPYGVGPGLIQFMKQHGGVKDAGGELRGMDMVKQRPGVVSLTGTDLDTMALDAWEAGYFPEFTERPAVNDLLEAIREELSGVDKLTEADQRTVEERNVASEQLLDFINEAGLDIETATNEEVKAALEEGLPDETLMQKAKRVVKGEKRAKAPDILEQPAYHGTPHKFDKFTLDHIGTGEGVQAFGWGLYFAGRKEIAEFYREELTDRKDPLKFKGIELDTIYTEEIEEKWADVLKDMTEDQQDDFIVLVATLAEYRTVDQAQDVLYAVGNSAQRMFKRLISPHLEEAPERVGQLFEVEIPDDTKLLNRDAPFKDQPEAVRKALVEAAEFDTPYEERKLPDLAQSIRDNESGEAIYRLLESETLGLGGDKEASLFLSSLGIPGLRFLDAYSRKGQEDAKYNYVIFDDAAIEVVETFYQDQNDPRAQITFLDDATVINLTKNADLTSFQHEAGHLFLRAFDQLAQLPNAAPEIVEDMGAVREWLGAAPGSKLNREQEEKFARGWEAYLWEGNAPSMALRRAFQRFSAWMRRVYSRIAGLKVEMTDDIRAVFDRMLASEEEIQAENAVYEVTQMEGLEGDMSAAEFADYSEGQIRAHREAVDDLTREKLKIVRAEAQQWAKNERERIKADVTARLNENPVYKAIAWLGKGTWISTEDQPANLKPMRLDRDKLEEDYGPEIFKYLKVSVPPVFGKEGVAADIAASAFGFETGDALLKALMDAVPKGQAIKNQTEIEFQAVLAERVDNGLNAEEDATQAVHNDEMAKALAGELRVMRRKAKAPHGPIQTIKDAAKRIIQESTLKVAQRVGTYRQAEFRARKKAQEAYLAEDYALAAEQKRIELLNHFKVTEALKAKERVRVITKRLKAAPKAKVIDADWRAQIEQLLNRYGMARIPDADRDTPELREFVLNHLAQELANSEDDDVAALFSSPMLAEWIFNEEDRREFDMLTLEQLTDLDNAVKYLKGKGKEAIAPEMATEEGTVDQAVNRRLEPMAKLDDKKHYAEEGLAARFFAFHTQLQHLFNRADGGGQGGRKHGANWRSYAELLRGQNAKSAHQHQLSDELKPHLEVLSRFIKRNPKRMLANLPTPQGFNGKQEDYWTPERVFTSLLHIGTDSNAARLMDGMRIGEDKEANEAFARTTLAALTKSLTAEELQAIQGIWDAVESLWPELAATHEKLYHFRPKKIPAREISVESADGTIVNLKGGYFPAIYDRRTTQNTKQTERYSKQDLLNSASAAFGSSTPNRSMTKERADGPAGLLLDFSINVLFAHIETSTTLIHLGLPLKDTQRVINNGKWYQAYVQKFGEKEYKTLQKILKNIANPGANRTDWGVRIARGVASPFILGLNYGVSLKQSLSSFSAIRDVGLRRYLRAALVTMPTKPMESYRFMVESSEQMRNRSADYSAEIAHAYTGKRMGRSDVWKIFDAVSSLPFLPIRTVDFLTVLPIWQAGYQHYMEAHPNDDYEVSHPEAVVHADALVNATQPAAGPVNQAAVQFESGGWQWFNMFMTYTIVFNNRARTEFQKFKANPSAGAAADFSLFLGIEAMLPVLAIELTHFAFFGDWDDEEEVMELPGSVVSGMVKLLYGGLLGVRDFVGAATDIMRGKRHFDPVRAPGAEIINRGVRDIATVAAAIGEGDPFSDESLFAIAEAVSIATKVPITQVYRRMKRDMDKFEEANR